MINIGEFNKLKVVRKSSIGYYLSDLASNGKDEILLKNNNDLNIKLDIDDEIDAFIYKDSEGRLTATLKVPLAKVADIAYLKVVSNTDIGAFIDIGLERDVLIPKREMAYILEEDKKYLFYLYVDKTGRLAATTYIDKYLVNSEEIKVGDEVTGVAYGIQTNGSVMVAISNTYRGVILKNEYYTSIKPGDELNLRVKKHFEDGKAALTPRGVPVDERLMLQEKILEHLKSHGGSMPYNDSSSPDAIKEIFHTSKKYFKNAVGGLMKQGLVTQDEYGTRMSQIEII